MFLKELCMLVLLDDADFVINLKLIKFRNYRAESLLP